MFTNASMQKIDTQNVRTFSISDTLDSIDIKIIYKRIEQIPSAPREYVYWNYFLPPPPRYHLDHWMLTVIKPRMISLCGVEQKFGRF